MNKIDEISQRINEIGENFIESLNKFQKELAELKESKKEGKWLPKEGEEYWFRDRCGDMEFFHYDTDHEGDRWRIDNLPVFPTEEDCKRYWHFMDTVKEKSYEFSKEEWEDGDITKWRIDCEDERFIISEWCSMCVIGGIYFKTREDAKYIIDNFEDELMEFFV